ncbi:MAG: 50S ribosomal protein L19 [Planctomycetota bacterium]
MAKNSELIQAVEAKYTTNKVPDVRVGDAVDVHVKVKEGAKERVQIFSGIVIAVSGHGIRRSFTVRRLIGQFGVERKFPFQSPKVAEVITRKRGIVRRAKLFYLRDRLGKVARIAEKRAHKPGATQGGAGVEIDRRAARKAERKAAKAAARVPVTAEAAAGQA